MSDTPETLCQTCKGLELETGFNWRLSKEQASSLGANFHDAYDENNRRLIIADVLHNLLQTMENCPFCLLVITAIQEQYKAKGKEMWARDPYCLRWLYVSKKVSWHHEFDGEFVRYIEVLSSANCDAKDLQEGQFHFEFETTKASVRSLIAPVVPIGVEAAPTLWARFVPPRVDPSRVKQWMKSCEEWHGSKCGEGSDGLEKELPSTSFSIIDVENLCIVSPSKPCRYITLSYTWGSNGENSFLALQKNIAELRAPRGLEKHMHSLPTTIQDAIAFTKALDVRYLWVDSLCIIQDDDKNKEANIASMGRVYENATLTLIAATGDHANAGLPGVRESSRNWTQRACRGDKAVFAVVDDLEMALHKSAWITRGWTYQEWFFSDRCLIFVGGQVIFSCRAATWRENIVAEREPTGELYPLNAIDLSYVSIDYELRPGRQYGIKFDPTMDFNMVFTHTLRDYLCRRLTYDTDILNAFSGVLDSFSQSLESTVVMGSITRLLDWSLGFEISRGDGRRKEFPSWTWCGWEGAPLWAGANEGLFEWTRDSTWILWHHRGTEPETITEIPREKHIEWDDSVEAQVARLDISEAEDDTMPFATRMLYHQFKFKRPIKATPFRLPKSSLGHPSIARNRGYLQFWTMGASLKFDYPTKRGELSLLDGDGDECGTVHVDSPLDASGPRRDCEIILLSQHNWALGVQTYLATKRRKDKGKGKSLSSKAEPRADQTVEKTGEMGRAREVVDGMLHVMLIAWDSGMAERLGIGTIWTESVHYLESPGLEWKEFVLA